MQIIFGQTSYLLCISEEFSQNENYNMYYLVRWKMGRYVSMKVWDEIYEELTKINLE